MKAIEVETLTKRYGSARGVEDLSFGIEQGEIFGYIGPNFEDGGQNTPKTICR